MHSHFGLQTQQFLSAPLILDDPKKTFKEQEVTLFIGDFSYKKPSAILAELIKPKSKQQISMHHTNKPVLNDVIYDAFLTNYHTLSNPEIVRVTPGQTVRLRIIAGSSMSNFFIKTGELDGQAIAVDGHVFEVTEINGKKLTDGAMRDTVFVLPHSIVKIQFDADNPGNWIMHCHMIYHMARGMISLVNYENTDLPKWMHFQ
jgi:FtsP/CotA-like multicopper oxidase with cupredoxin domain